MQRFHMYLFIGVCSQGKSCVPFLHSPPSDEKHRISLGCRAFNKTKYFQLYQFPFTPIFLLQNSNTVKIINVYKAEVTVNQNGGCCEVAVSVTGLRLVMVVFSIIYRTPEHGCNFCTAASKHLCKYFKRHTLPILTPVGQVLQVQCQPLKMGLHSETSILCIKEPFQQTSDIFLLQSTAGLYFVVHLTQNVWSYFPLLPLSCDVLYSSHGTYNRMSECGFMPFQAGLHTLYPYG